MPTAPNNRLEGLDALRAWAAVGVIIVHVYSLNQITFRPAIQEFFSKFVLGVELFFALSAFCLALGYFGKLSTEDATRRYLLRRFFRLAPLMYFMIAFWAIEMTRRYDAFPGWGTIVLNASFLFGIAPGKANGIVWAGWSLGVEMLFYFAFPLICMFVKSWRAAVVFTLGTLVISIACRWTILDAAEVPKSYARQNIVTALPFFAMGLLAYFIWRILRDAPQRKTISYWLLGGSLVWWIAVGLTGLGSLRVGDLPIGHYAIALAFPALILSQALHPLPLISNSFTNRVGEWGYSVYLLHPAVILFTMPLVRSVYGTPDAMKSGSLWPFFWSCLIVTAITIALAAVTYYLIETPGRQLGRRLEGPRPPAAPPSPAPQAQAL